MSIGKVSSTQFKYSVLALSMSCVSPLIWASEKDLVAVGEVSGEVGRELIEVNGIKRAGVVVDGVPYTVDSSVLPESYLVRNGGVLNVQSGAVVDSIFVTQSELNINDGLVREGISVFGGAATINAAAVANGSGGAMLLGSTKGERQSLSSAYVTGSQLQGKRYGVLISPMGELWLQQSHVEGISDEESAAGIWIAGGKAHIREASHVVGSASAVRIFNGVDGVFEEQNRLEVDGSKLTALTGAAIEVVKTPDNKDDKTNADILIANHSVLEAGNNRLIDVRDESTAKVEVNNSQLQGDLVADDTSTLNVALRNHARLDGNIVNGNAVVIDSSGHWQLAGDNAVKSLAIDGGSVGFSEEASHTLSLGQLSGRGRFDMRINLNNGTGDLLNVTGNASGNHLLNIRNTGEEAVPAEFEALRVVHTESGDAQFRLRGARVDLGAYSYALEQQGTDWFIVGSGKTISPSTQSALALFSAGPTIWNSELSTLRSRMGEVRGREEGGGWMRSYGSRFNASLDAGVKYRQKQQGLSFGADAPVPVSDGHLLVGVMGGYSQSDLDMDRGTSGEVDSYYLGAYGTWLSEEGYYLDGVVKVNKFYNQSRVAMSDGEKAKGNYNNMAVGGSLEFGKHVKLPDDYFVEPFAQLSSVWIDGDRYTLDNGLQAKTSQTQSVLGKVGATVGRQFVLKDGGVVQPYVRVAGAHEFSRGNDVSVNGQRFDNDVFGSRFELGTGVSVSLSERLQVHADFDYMKGEHVDQPWGANVGVRLAF